MCSSDLGVPTRLLTGHEEGDAGVRDQPDEGDIGDGEFHDRLLDYVSILLREPARVHRKVCNFISFSGP